MESLVWGTSRRADGRHSDHHSHTPSDSATRAPLPHRHVGGLQRLFHALAAHAASEHTEASFRYPPAPPARQIASRKKVPLAPACGTDWGWGELSWAHAHANAPDANAFAPPAPPCESYGVSWLNSGLAAALSLCQGDGGGSDLTANRDTHRVLRLTGEVYSRLSVRSRSAQSPRQTG